MKAQGTSADSPSRPTDREHKGVFEHLDTWEQRSLLSHEQAEAIRRFESTEAATAPRIPLITEVVAYLGAALAVGAVVALLGPRWEDISRQQKLLGSAIIAIALVVAGALLRRTSEPAVQRLAGVLWTLAVCSMTGFLALLLFDLPRGQDPAPWSWFALGAAAAVAAFVMVSVLPSAPLLVALFAAAATAAIGAGAWANWGDRDTLGDFPAWPGVVLLVVSLVFLAAGTRGALAPRGAASAIGAIGAVIAPLFAMDEGSSFGMLLGVGVAAGLLGLSVWQRSTPMLIAGAIGLFVYLVATIVYYLSDTVGVPIALLLSGAALLGVAVVTARLKRFTAGVGRGAD